jgi:hypothetical protein
LCINSSAADNLAHDRIAGETVGVVDILVSGQPRKAADARPDSPSASSSSRITSSPPSELI